jgi:hypothetical protein
MVFLLATFIALLTETKGDFGEVELSNKAVTDLVQS